MHQIASTAELDVALPATPRRKSVNGPSAWPAAIVVTLLLAVVPAVLWPGDVTWMCDEPILVGQAVHYNEAHELAPRGLGGTLFVPYGPLATQIYQLLLHFTNDLRVIVTVRALGCSLMIAVAFLWLAKSLNLTPWFAAAVVLAPYVVWSERVMWDASFMLPIGALGVAAYAAFLRKGSRVALSLAVLALTWVPLIHLMGLTLFAAFAGHALWRHCAALLRSWLGVLAAVVCILIFNGRYIRIVTADVTSRFHALFSKGYSAVKLPLHVSMSGPFLGGKLLNGEHFANQMSRLTGPGKSVEIAVLLSEMVIPVIWLGIAVCVVTLLRHWTRKWSADGTQDPTATASECRPTRLAIMGIALTCLLLQVLLACSLRVPPLAQYCFGTYPVHVLFAWFGFSALGRLRIARALIGLWGLSLAVITLGSAWQVHRQSWDRDLMSPTLTNQIEVVTALNRYSDQTVLTNVLMYGPHQYPMAIRDLRLILPRAANPVRSPFGLLIRYAADPYPKSSRIELIEIASPDDIPDDAHALDASPMPKLY